jgi:hypothetical protein
VKLAMETLKSVVAPLPCRPDADVGNFSAGKQPEELFQLPDARIGRKVVFQRAACIDHLAAWQKEKIGWRKSRPSVS